MPITVHVLAFLTLLLFVMTCSSLYILSEEPSTECWQILIPIQNITKNITCLGWISGAVTSDALFVLNSTSFSSNSSFFINVIDPVTGQLKFNNMINNNLEYEIFTRMTMGLNFNGIVMVGSDDSRINSVLVLDPNSGEYTKIQEWNTEDDPGFCAGDGCIYQPTLMPAAGLYIVPIFNLGIRVFPVDPTLSPTVISMNNVDTYDTIITALHVIPNEILVVTADYGPEVYTIGTINTATKTYNSQEIPLAKIVQCESSATVIIKNMVSDLTTKSAYISTVCAARRIIVTLDISRNDFPVVGVVTIKNSQVPVEKDHYQVFV